MPSARRGRSVTAAAYGSLAAMDDLQVGHAPALVTHVLGHHAEALGLHLAHPPPPGQRVAVTGENALAAVEVGREDQALTVEVGPYEQHRSPHGVEPHQVGPAPQAVHAHPALVAPGVPVEGRASVAVYAMGLDDVLACRQHLLQDIAWVVDDVDVEPQHP